MIENIDATKVLFFDIETVSSAPTYGDMDEVMQDLWKYKARSVLKRYNGEEITDEEYASSYLDAAGIFAEFGKIVCISVGLVYRDKESNQLQLRLKSYADRDEKKLLEGFSELLSQYYNNPSKFYLCGHNIKEFDVPVVCRRMIVNGMGFPKMLDVTGKKPWETAHLLDTMQLWKFGDYKSYTSLKLLAGLLGFPSPKDDIDGSMVGRVFWEDDDLDRIAHYCEKDVLATTQLFLRYQLKPLLVDEQVHHVG
jgi:predicted PolB exonuclease-like 3'-5' exonuclease